MDCLIESKVGKSIASMIEKEGWDFFRKMETELLLESLFGQNNDKVIASGGGIVELELNRKNIREFERKGGIVIHLRRDIESIIEFLNQDKSRPSFTDDLVIFCFILEERLGTQKTPL